MLRSLRMWMRTSPGGYDTGLAGSFCVSVSATCSCHSAVNSSDFIYISQRPWNRKGAARKRSQGPRWIKRFYLLRKLVAYPDRAPIFLAASHPRCSIPISFRIVCVFVCVFCLPCWFNSFVVFAARLLSAPRCWFFMAEIKVTFSWWLILCADVRESLHPGPSPSQKSSTVAWLCPLCKSKFYLKILFRRS